MVVFAGSSVQIFAQSRKFGTAQKFLIDIIFLSFETRWMQKSQKQDSYCLSKKSLNIM